MKFIRIEGSVKLSKFITPMMATLSDQPAFDSDDWIFEIKWDGYRAVSEIGPANNKLYSRNGQTFDKKFEKVFNALDELEFEGILDGEIVVFNAEGKPSFEAVQNYSKRDRSLIQYQVFDCLQLNGKDLTRKPLIERKSILKEVLTTSEVIKYCDHIVGEGKLLFEHASKMGIEGIMAKKASSLYFSGRRSKDWLKIKDIKKSDFVIVGYTDPKSSRQYFGALLLAIKRNGKLVFAGEVGTGFTAKSLKELYTKLQPILRNSSPLSIEIKKQKDWHWVEPHFICQVKYIEMTNDGLVRHPSFGGLTTD